MKDVEIFITGKDDCKKTKDSPIGRMYAGEFVLIKAALSKHKKRWEDIDESSVGYFPGAILPLRAAGTPNKKKWPKDTNLYAIGFNFKK